MRVELSVPADAAALLDEQEYPQKPRKALGSFASGRAIPPPSEPTVRVRHVGKVNVAVISAGKVQPHSTVWLSDQLYVAGFRSGEIELQGSITADNLPTRTPASLKIQCKSEQQRMSFYDLQRIESDRFAAEEGRALRIALENRKDAGT